MLLDILPGSSSQGILRTALCVSYSDGVVKTFPCPEWPQGLASHGISDR